MFAGSACGQTGVCVVCVCVRGGGRLRLCVWGHGDDEVDGRGGAGLK